MSAPVTRPLVSIVTLLALASGCDSLAGETDVTGLIASQFVSVTLDQDAVDGGAIAAEKAVNPDTFLAQVREKMATIDAVSITRIKIDALDNGAVGADAWSDILSGELVVTLVPQSGNPIEAAHVTVPASGRDVLVTTVTATRAQLDAAPDIAAGRFSVRLSAATPRQASDTFALTARVEIEFIAF